MGVDILENNVYNAAMIDVKLEPAAVDGLMKLPVVMRTRILGIVERLKRWPAVSGAKPLTGRLAGHYRIRTGDYRVQFFLRNNILWIEQIGHRDGLYED
jgi:mRNA-degrading endonuclease RelE of RelBE toxin-antitoxin system